MYAPRVKFCNAIIITVFELGYKKQGPDSIGLKKTGSPKTGSQRDSTLADNVMACFFLM